MAKVIQEEILEEKQDAKKYIYILVVFIGFIILASTYVAYTYFNNAEKNTVSEEKIADVEVTEIVPVENDEKETVFQNPTDSFGIDNSGVKGAQVTSVAPSVTAVTIIPSSQLEQTKPSDTSGISNARTWKANNYKFGDIKIGQYTVIYGDTLWELAEGAYGNGYKWINIAKANTIQYFSNGRPLINIGQILNIPAL